MAKEAVAGEEKAGLIQRIKDFYQEVLTEMKKVTWPTRDELKTSTSVVLLLLVICAVVIYFYDAVFQVLVFGLLRLF
jgi:preprotein translocase subunit SecE